MSIWEMNGWKLFLAGGPVMWPILLCSILAVGIFIERLWYFSIIESKSEDLKMDILEQVKKNNLKEAVRICETSDSLLGPIFKAGIVKSGSTRGEIKEVMEEMSSFEIPKLESKLSALATIANIAPLLGLLGTVAGITSSFHTISARANTSNPVSPGELVGGIGEALIATLAGLMVAILAFVAYNYCVSRVKNITLALERRASELLNLLNQMTSTN